MRPGNQTALPASQSTGLNRGRGARHLAGGWRKGGQPRGAAFRSATCRGGRMPRSATAASAGADACQPWGRTFPPRRPTGGTGKGGDKSAIHLAEMAANCQAPGAIQSFKDGTDEFSCRGQALCGFLAFETGQSAQLLQVLVQRPIMVRDEGAEFLSSAFDNTHPRMKAEALAAGEKLGVSRLRVACGCAHTRGPASAPCAIQVGRAGRPRCCPL